MKSFLVSSMIFFVILFGCSSYVFAQSKTISIATLNLPPIIDENISGYGFVGELFQEVFKPFGYDVDIKIYPWARGFEISKNGQFADGIFPSIHKTEREKWFYYSDPIITSGYVLITRKDTGITTYNSLNEFKNTTIGILRQGVTGSIIDNSEFKKEVGKDFEMNIKKLLGKRLNLITGEYLSILNVIDKIFPDKKDELVIIEPPISYVDLFLMISKNSPNASELLKDCNRGVAAIKSNGVLEIIRDKYGIKNIKKSNSMQ